MALSAFSSSLDTPAALVGTCEARKAAMNSSANLATCLEGRRRRELSAEVSDAFDMCAIGQPRGIDVNPRKPRRSMARIVRKSII